MQAPPPAIEIGYYKRNAMLHAYLPKLITAK